MKIKFIIATVALVIFSVCLLRIASPTHAQTNATDKQRVFAEIASPATTPKQHNKLMGLARREGFLNDVIAEYARQVKLQPNNPILESAYAEAFAYAHDVQLNTQGGMGWLQQDYDAAQSAAKDAVKGKGKYISYCWTSLGYFYSATNTNLIGAREAFQEAARLDPDNARVHDYLANTYIIPGKYCNPQEALRQVRIAIRLNKNLAAAYDTEAYAYMDLNNNKAAYTAWKKYVSFFKPDQITPVTHQLLIGLKQLAGK